MRIFFDFEFIEGGSAFVMEPISLGMVREDGEEFYREFWCDWGKANSWVLENVKPHLLGDPKITTDLNVYHDYPPSLRYEILEFCEEKPEFWAYYADYDWVILCQIFGRMVDLPDGWPMWCRDIKQYMWHLGIEKEQIPVRKGAKEHFALDDARWNKDAFTFCKTAADIFCRGVKKP